MKKYNVVDFGAVADGKALNTKAVQKAIDVCYKNGGGTVVFPAGNFVLSTVFLKSNVQIELSDNTVILGSKSFYDYCPDEKVYGEYFIEVDKLRQMLQELSYFSKGLRISLKVDDNEEEIFQSKNGLIDGLDSKNAISSPFHYEYKTDDCEVELALQWVKKRGKIKGYANGLYMPDGGAFISGFKSSLTRTFNNLANSKFDGDIIRNVLDGFVSVKVKVGQFSNQAKTALANPEARTATSTAITEALKQFALEHSTEFNSVVAMLEKLEKADEAAEKARNAILNQEKKEAEQKKRKINTSDKFKDCEKHGEESMLIICEGETN